VGAWVSALTFTSVPGGTNPYLADAPQGAGQEINVITGQVTFGGYTVQIVDAITAGTDRAVTDQLADAFGNYTLLGRVADFSHSTDGATWTVALSGYVDAIRFPRAILAEITIGDALRIDRRRDVFGSTRLADGTPSSFDRATAIVGGPVRGFWGSPAFDYGPWRMKVGSASGTTVRLDFMTGNVPVTNQLPFAPAYEAKTENIGSAAIAIIDALALPHRRQRPGGFWYPGLEARLEEVGSATVELVTPIVGNVTSGTPEPFTSGSRIYVEWVGTLPAVNDEYDVYVQPIEISDDNPLHIQDHPIDIHTALWDDAGIPYDAASAAAVKAIIGPDRVMVLRIDGKWKLSDFEEQVLQGPFRYGWRQGTDGEREFYSTRREAAVPGTSIVIGDLLGDADDQPVIFDLSESTIVRSVTVTQTVFVPWTQVNAEERPSDIALTREETVSVEHAVAVDGQDLTFTIPGYIGTEFSWQGTIASVFAGLDAFTRSLATLILQQFGYGSPSGELLVSESVTTQPGAEVVLNLPHQINGSVRGGTRIVQVVQRTERFADGGVLLKFIDAGSTAQAPTVPTFTLAANATSPKAFVDVAITNAATLVTDNSAVTFEWGIGGSAPASGANLIFINPADDTSFTTPRVDSGSQVWIRARAETFGEMTRPSAWSAWSSINLADLTAPTALTRTGNVLEWTTGEGPQEVLWRPAAESVDRSLGILASGSNRFDLTGAVPPGTSIVATVRSVDEPPYRGVSTDVTLSFTTGGAASLTAPSSLNGSRVVEFPPQDQLTWVAAGNPIGTTYHIEQSTLSGISGYTEIDSVVDSLTKTVDGTYASDTWYRVRASAPGYTTTAYSAPYQLSL
jgi:hypothetical protein